MADPAAEPPTQDYPNAVERARMRRDATERVARANADESTVLRIELEELRLVSTWQAGRIGALAGQARIAVEVTRELGRLRDVLGMGLEEDPSAYLARIREEATAAERERWSTAAGLSSPEAAQKYIAKLEGELEAAGKPTPHQPPAPAPVVVANTVGEVDPAKVAAAVDKAAAEAKGDGKRRATPRRERFTVAELCAAVAAVRARALGPSSMTEQLPDALAPFIGKVLVATPAGEQPAPAAEPTEAEREEYPTAAPGETIAEARAKFLARVGVTVQWVPTEYGHNLVADLPERPPNRGPFLLASVKHLFPPGAQDGDHDVETMFGELFPSPGAADSHAPHADAEHRVRRTLHRLVVALEDALPVPPPFPRSPAA